MSEQHVYKHRAHWVFGGDSLSRDWHSCIPLTVTMSRGLFPFEAVESLLLCICRQQWNFERVDHNRDRHGYCLIEYLLVASVRVNSGREGMAFGYLFTSARTGSRWGETSICVWAKEGFLGKWWSWVGTSLAWLGNSSIWWMRAFFLRDVTPAEFHRPSQGDGEGLSAAPQSRSSFLKYVQLLNPQEAALVCWIKKELLCPCKQPECGFVPGESWWGGSGYSLFRQSQKWTDLFLRLCLSTAAAPTQGHQSAPCPISHLQRDMLQVLQFTSCPVLFLPVIIAHQTWQPPRLLLGPVLQIMM